MSFTLDTNLMLVGMVTVLAVVSPGPDFAIIVRNGILHGRKFGLATALGIACGVTVHVTYTLLGLGYIVATYSWVLKAIKYLGAAYLLWLGVSAFLPKKENNKPDAETACKTQTTFGAAFRNGFLCNALNPKTVLFFIALFTQVVEPATPAIMQIGIGIFISLTHFAWFAFVVLALTNPHTATIFSRCKGTIEKAVGACLFGLGAKIALES